MRKINLEFFRCLKHTDISDIWKMNCLLNCKQWADYQNYIKFFFPRFNHDDAINKRPTKKKYTQ